MDRRHNSSFLFKGVYFGPALLVASALIFLLSFAFFYSVISLRIETDIQLHVAYLESVLSGEKSWPPNFLFYALVWALTGFSIDPQNLTLAAIFLLALAVLLKFFMTLHILRHVAVRAVDSLRVFISIMMLLAFSLPSANFLARGNYYLGQITPNVWHNSTTITLFPLALLLYWKQLQAIQDQDRKAIPLLFLLVAANILVKPSFFMAFVPATTLYLVLKFGWRKELLIYGGPIAFGLILLAIQYFLIYHIQIGGLEEGESRLEVYPFKMWGAFLSKELIPVAVASSFIFPIFYFACGLRPAMQGAVGYALLLSASSLLIFIIFRETGPRVSDGNFYWQNVVSMYILILILAADLLAKWTAGQRCWRIRLCAWVFVLYPFSGVCYLSKFLITSSYF